MLYNLHIIPNSLASFDTGTENHVCVVSHDSVNNLSTVYSKVLLEVSTIAILKVGCLKSVCKWKYLSISSFWFFLRSPELRTILPHTPL